MQVLVFEMVFYVLCLSLQCSPCNILSHKKQVCFHFLPPLLYFEILLYCIWMLAVNRQCFHSCRKKLVIFLSLKALNEMSSSVVAVTFILTHFQELGVMQNNVLLKCASCKVVGSQTKRFILQCHLLEILWHSLVLTTKNVQIDLINGSLNR